MTRQIPRAALWLGLAGLIPFFGLAFATLLPDDATARYAGAAFSLYAAVILSFLGGIRWGLEIARAPSRPDPRRLTLSTLPSIAAWLLAAWAVLTPGQTAAASAFAGLFAAQYVWDRASRRDAGAPDWYPTLREILTGGVMLSCLALIGASAIGRI